MEHEKMNRRAFIQGALAVGALGTVSLVGCSPAPKTEETKPEPEPAPVAVTSWVDAVTSASVATNKYTNYDKMQTVEVINAHTAACSFATTNEDGTPNLAIFAGGQAMEGEYIIFNWTDNQTKANLMRDKLGVIAYDVVTLDAPTKEERHKGSRVRVQLVEDAAERDKLKAVNDKIADATVIVKIIEVLPVG